MTVVIVGWGGHAKVVYDLFLACGETIAGFIDRCPISDPSVKYLGTDDVWPDLISQGMRRAHVAIGNNEVRAKLCKDLQNLGVEIVTAVHPSAYVSASSELEAGVVVMAGAIIQPWSQVGAFSIINTRATIDHDAKIGCGVHIGPGVTLAGSVVIGDLSFIGAGSTIIPGIKIGSRTIIGAGSCVVRSIPDDVIAYGVPAKLRSQRPRQLPSCVVNL